MALYTQAVIRFNFTKILGVYSYSKYSKAKEYKRCYQVLGIPENSDQEEVRKAYLFLVKKFHPDSGNEQANVEKFQEIDSAFKILMNKITRERFNTEEEGVVEEKDIQHTAPQHRQYLSYGGVGSGTPFQREKQFAKTRAMQATENVLQHRLSKASAEENTLMNKISAKHKIKTKYGFERLVEDLIQEAMSKGEFNNLSGKGKPLPEHNHRNPYVDFVTHKLNQVLIDNGFTPEWIMLQKEIREEIQKLRSILYRERENFGPFPLTVDKHIEWSEIVFKYAKVVNKINRKINKYNLIVPVLDKQMLLVNLSKEAQHVLITGKYCANENVKQIEGKPYNSGVKEGVVESFLGLLSNILKK